MRISLAVILVGFVLSLVWIGYMVFSWISFNAGSEVMVDGITISVTIVTILSVVFSIVSWFLFSWASHNINTKGIMLSVITGVVLITPFNGVLGPMAAVLVGLAAGFSAYMIQKKVADNTENKSIIVGIAILVASYVVLFVLISIVQGTSHVWDSGSGMGTWTGTTDGVEP